MSQFACSFEAGNGWVYTDAGMWWGVGLDTATRHTTLAGLGGAYSVRDGAQYPVIGTADRWLHYWVANTAWHSIMFRLGGQIQARADIDSMVSLYRGDRAALLGTSPPYAGGWRGLAHWVAIRLDAFDAPNGIFEVWSDGVSRIALAGVDTQQLAGSLWDQFWFQVSGDMRFDDVITTTAAEGRLVETYCQPQLPSSNVVVVMTPVGAATNWQAVNEVPASSSQYVQTLVVGAEDSYGTADPAAPWGTVFCAAIWLWGLCSGAVTQARTGIEEGGSTSYRAYSAMPLVGNWGKTIWQIETSKPTGGAWTDAALDAAILHVQFN